MSSAYIDGRRQAHVLCKDAQCPYTGFERLEWYHGRRDQQRVREANLAAVMKVWKAN